MNKVVTRLSVSAIRSCMMMRSLVAESDVVAHDNPSWNRTSTKSIVVFSGGGSIIASTGTVLDDLVEACHLEQDLIASITAHEHATRGRHDVFFGVSAHERTEIVARQTDVLEHGLHLGKMRTQCFRYANVALEHGSGTHAGQDLL